MQFFCRICQRSFPSKSTVYISLIVCVAPTNARDTVLSRMIMICSIPFASSFAKVSKWLSTDLWAEEEVEIEPEFPM